MWSARLPCGRSWLDVLCYPRVHGALAERVVLLYATKCRILYIACCSYVGVPYMRSGGQLSLLPGAGRGHLFGKELLDRYVDSHKTTAIPRAEEHVKTIAGWLTSLSTTKATETTLEGPFISDIFCGVLGYRLYPGGPGETSSIYQKPSSQITRIGRQPDAMLGQFDVAESRFTAVLELKTPGTNLDAPQPRTNNETPVEQGFYYGRRILGVRWVLISDMRRIRLYSVESDGEYEEIELAQCFDARKLPTDTYRRLHFLLHHDYLVSEHDKSQVSLLHDKSAAQQLDVRDSFYQAYYDIRTDLYKAIEVASKILDPKPDRRALLEATQRLLDRIVFILFCESHPQRLIPPGTLDNVCKAARMLPGVSRGKVYEALKSLFKEVDAGSPISNQIRLSGYNGELFKDHPIIDHIDLPDELYDRRYTVSQPKGAARIIQGVWGLHKYDFWTELNEHLLGHIFEQSLSDLADVGCDGVRSAAERLQERKHGGIYYTSSLLSDFLASSAIQSLLDETAPLDNASDLEAALERRSSALMDFKVADFACGSGAFLVSAYHELLREYRRLQASLATIRDGKRSGDANLFDAADATDQAGLLRQCLYGVDLLPQAVEIAKLALWLASARKGEKVADLSANIIDADSLAMDAVLRALSLADHSLDLVTGNPPWGGDVDQPTYEEAARVLGLQPEEQVDTWEMFLLMGLHALRDGGRLALVIPDSFFYTDKEKTRRRLLEAATVEKIHYLGADWFGTDVRMGTVVIQARRGVVDRSASILCSVLAGDLRRQSIKGKIPLTQVEASIGLEVPLARALDGATADFEVFRSTKDDGIIDSMVSHSVSLGELCERGRGEEINKAGLLWICPSCGTFTTPGAKKKGGGYKDKACPKCSHAMTEGNTQTDSMLAPTGTTAETKPFIVGEDIDRRYHAVTPGRRIRADVQGWSYKPDSLYATQKILIRQAGVGLAATLDDSGAYCPQSVYIYRLRDEYRQQGYSLEYVLAALLSRTMTYFIFKRYAEIDSAKAHAKLTHERLQCLPIPKLDLSCAHEKQLHDSIVGNVRRLLGNSPDLGGPDDTAIELSLRELWKLDTNEGAYINGQFYGLDNSQAVRDLFPSGPPKPQGGVLPGQ